MHSRSEIKRLAVQAPEKLVEEIERLRELLAKARDALSAAVECTHFDQIAGDIYDALRSIDESGLLK